MNINNSAYKDVKGITVFKGRKVTGILPLDQALDQCGILAF